MAPGVFTDIKNLHERGLVTIICDSDQKSKKFLTCGTDGTVYIWDEASLLGKENPTIMTVADATHSCLSWKDSTVYLGYTTTDLLTGIDKKVVGRATLEELESPTQVFSFSLESTSVVASSKYLIAGGSEFAIKVLKLDGDENYSKIDSNGEVLSISIDPKEEVFAVSCANGNVSIYSLESPEKGTIASFDNIFHSFGSIEVDHARVTLSWSRDGSSLYVPAQGSVKVINREGWKIDDKSFKLKGAETETFSTLSLSPCGMFLCASTLNKKICIWRTTDREVVSSNEYKRIAQGKNIVTSVAFAPFDPRSILVADANEGLSMWKNAIPSSIEVASSEKTSAAANSINKSNTRKGMSQFSDSEDDDDEASNQPRAKKNKSSFVLDDEADEVEMAEDGFDDEVDGDTRMSADLGGIKKRYGFGDDTTGKLEDYGFGQSTDSNHAPTGFPPGFSGAPSAPTTVTKIVEYEPPTIPSQFVSGSSPSHLSQRYLKWNTVGVIRSYNNQEENNIEIEYHDASIHSEIIIDNSAAGYVLGDLSDQAVALASSPEDKVEQSEMLVIHIKSWDPESRRWNVKLPLGDAALDLLVSRQYVAVITEQRNVRVFTLAGTQRHIITHPGPILTSTIFDSKITVASVTGGEYHEERRGQRKTKPQYQVSLSTYDLDAKSWFRAAQSNVSTVPVALAPGHKLEWLSYSNEGQLAMMDTSFTVRLLAPGGFWMPIFDGASELKAKSDGLWPIAVVEGRQKQFRYLYCKGTKHPQMAVKTAPLIAPWSMPFCQPETDKSQLEQTVMLNELRQSEVYSCPDLGDISELSTVHLQSLVKLFALACKSERETRASELARLVASSKGIQVMCNYAAAMKKHVLSEKVAAIGRENVSLEDSLFSSSSIAPPREAEKIAPRRVSMNSSAAAMRRKMGSVTAPTEDDIFEESPYEDPMTVRELEDVDVEDSQGDDVMNESTDMLSTQHPIIPASQMRNRNPFKRSLDTTLDTSSVSVFDQLESSFDNPRKRVREEEKSQKTAPASRKQMKLSFGGGSTPKGKENGGVTAYSLWLGENEKSMKEVFSGESDEFEKFCMGQYRLLPPAQKKEWKQRAETASN